jgi:3-isopropylmalate/(R)-2-methylmalate dehydratase small subunit
MPSLRGRVHKFGANIDTDVIIPARYLNMYTPEELAPHCLEGVDPEFARRVQPGDIILADTNFGCGSSREHAPLAIRGAGVSCVVAKSFARIFYRNAINLGLPILECPEAVDGSDPGDELAVELESGTIRNLTKEVRFQAKPYPEFMLGLLAAGGLVEYTKRRLAAGKRP